MNDDRRLTDLERQMRLLLQAELHRQRRRAQTAHTPVARIAAENVARSIAVELDR